MAQLVLDISRADFPAYAAEESSFEIANSAAFIPAIILAALQIADGVLTWIGITNFGASAEGNLLMRILIETYGVTTALICAKGIAIAIVYCLASLSSKVEWIPTAMKIVIGIYLVFAIIPWTAILIHNAL